MGGKGSGGARVGAGRRRKSAEEGALTGSRRVRARAKEANQTAAAVNQTPVTPQSPTTAMVVASTEMIPQPPGSLTLDELAEWNDLAPRAAKVGTLDDSTKFALRDLCQARVLKDRLLRQVSDLGNLLPGASGTVVANPLLARFTTLLQRVEAGMMRFKLSPIGKELDKPGEKAADPFAEFDGGSATTDRTVN